MAVLKIPEQIETIQTVAERQKGRFRWHMMLAGSDEIACGKKLGRIEFWRPLPADDILQEAIKTATETKICPDCLGVFIAKRVILEVKTRPEPSGAF